MAYLSKDTLLNVYKILSENTNTPDTQGATQKISAIRHLFALARFLKEKGLTECNLKDRTNRDTFITYVSDIVKLDDNYYTTNFYTGIRDLQDCGVSSNFFSAGAVAKSRVNPQVAIPYPASKALFNVKNESLLSIKWNQLPLLDYIPSAKCRLALALWLVRKSVIDEDNILTSIKSILCRSYPSELIEALLSPINLISDAFGDLQCVFSHEVAIIEKNDLKALFGDWESGDDNISNDDDLLPEKVKELFKKFLERCCKTSHKTDQNPLFLSENAPGSYMSFLEPNRLFDYNPSKWAHISSMYEITNATEAENIFTQLLADSAFIERDKTNNQGWRSGAIGYYVCFLNALNIFSKVVVKTKTPNALSKSTTPSTYSHYLTALRTKPFMLLAGISGTGKSRIVRKLAQASVTEELQRKYDEKSLENGFERWQLHKPANFELVQVKPNWHNSLEVVGYKSNIGSAHYEFTPFVRFVARAWQHPDVPFFLCLDEMNLAPVEQYFAEFLSAIESRSIENGEYETDPIIKPFSEFNGTDANGKVTDNLADRMIAELLGKLDSQEKSNLAERFRTKGLTLPKNLFVLGTVNMDETTFSFSRKVLDRAMSIVMNEVNYDQFFTGESENDMEEMSSETIQLLINREIRGVQAEQNDSDSVESYLSAINEVLDNTPFKLGYRAANEALLYVSATHLMSNKSTTDALDEFTLMKILSRIEGDKRSIGTILTELQEVITEVYPQSNKKLIEMAETLNSKQFVSYWS